MLKKITLLLIFCFVFVKSNAQNDSIWQQKPQLNISGFVDVFYVYDFNKPSNNIRQAFLFNHNRHNEVNLNLGFIKLGLNHTKYRANLAFHAGTYSIDNYSAEPGSLKNIFEANVGLALNKLNTLWLDAGIMPSHLGFESAISNDNLTLTRSILAENSPYFMAGTKLTYALSKNITISGLMLNGWQRIKRQEGNSMPAFGSQLIITTKKKSIYNWGTFIGSEFADTNRKMRYFNNFYGQFQISKKWKSIASFDIGFQQSAKKSNDYNYWFSPAIIVQYKITKKWIMAFRAEYYEDKKSIIIKTNNLNQFAIKGFSINLDYAPSPNLLCRIEGRWFNNKEKIFVRNNQLSNDNLIIASSISVFLF